MLAMFLICFQLSYFFKNVFYYFFEEQYINKITFYRFIKFEKKKLSSLMLKEKKWRKSMITKRENKSPE